MTRRLAIEWAPERKVTGLLSGPVDAAGTGILLANGAGASQRSAFMTSMRRALAAAGFAVLTFDYPYQEAGRRSPDARSRLDACHLAAAARLNDYVDSVVWAGKSMGGRIGSHLVAGGAAAVALVFFGYPLVPVGKSEPRPTDHLEGIDRPMLFVQGTRDGLAPLDLLAARIAPVAGAEIAVIEDGDHSFRVPRRAGLAYDEVLADIAAITVAWLREAVAG